MKLNQSKHKEGDFRLSLLKTAMPRLQTAASIINENIYPSFL